MLKKECKIVKIFINNKRVLRMFAPYIIKVVGSLVDEECNISSFWAGSNPPIDID